MFKSNIFKVLAVFGILSVFSIGAVQAENAFSAAIRTCQPYSKDGAVVYEGQTFNILVTLQKKADKCVYKEKIYQDKKYQMLTCNFEKSQLGPIADSMEKYNKIFKVEIAKNSIFEAKMTTNGEVFQNYLANPKYCSISHSKEK